VVSFVLRTATISIFLSDAKGGPVCRAQTCAHSGVEPSRSAKAFLQGGPKTSNFWPFLAFTSPISQRPLKIEAYKQRMKLFDPPCRNTKICPPWKSCLEGEWRVCVSSTDALVKFFLLFFFAFYYLPCYWWIQICIMYIMYTMYTVRIIRWNINSKPPPNKNNPRAVK